jgi:hypothetical protein
MKKCYRAALLGSVLLPIIAAASSHREAPAIAGMPRDDATDFYMFRSYEAGRSGFVTLIANYIPFEDPQGGPNFYNLDDHAVYKINIDNTGSGTPSMVFSFQFKNAVQALKVDAGGVKVAVPVLNVGPVSPAGANLNVIQSYTVSLQTAGGTPQFVTDSTTHSNVFYKPADNIGNKSIPDYAAYAATFMYTVLIPGCNAWTGRLFVGQRKDSFFVDLGELFDLVNLSPLGPRDAKKNDLTGKNVTSIALEVPLICLRSATDPVIGAYTTAERAGSTSNQVSRLGMPLVNEVIIGLPDKNKFNASKPSDDAQFLTYVTNPSFPVILNALFGTAAQIPGMPRQDLVAAYLTGVPKLNQPIHVTPSEMLRLNTATLPTAPASQNDLGVLGNDLAGFPNGRRPYDDVVDITLRVAEGALCGTIGNCGTMTADPNHGAPYTDGVRAAGADLADSHVTGAINAADTYLAVFPYLNTPIAASPQGVQP